MNCPNDRQPLEHSKYEGDIEIDSCPTCQGVWLDHGEMERIQELAERDYSDELSRPPDDVLAAFRAARQLQAEERNCPSCGHQLERREHGYCSQIIVETCPSCRGVWLDAGELQALEVFFERAQASTRDSRLGFLGSLLGAFP